MSVTVFPWSNVADVERRHILETLLHCNGNRTCAAKVLGISNRGLRTKLGKYEKEGFEKEGFIVPRPGAFPRAARMPGHLIPQPTFLPSWSEVSISPASSCRTGELVGEAL